VLEKRLIELVLLTATFAAACTPGGDAGSSDSTSTLSEQVTAKGYAVFGHEVRTFRACGAEDPVWAIDSTGTLWTIHQDLAPGQEPYEEVFAVLTGTPGDAPTDGFGADYPASFYVDKLLYAAREGWGCNLELNDFHFRIAGNEPFWTLTISELTAELVRMGYPEETWNDLRTAPNESGFSFSSSERDSGQLDIQISETTCRDTMSGAYHAYSATVTVAGEQLSGCAILGTSR